MKAFGREWHPVEIGLGVLLLVLLLARFGPEIRIRAGLPVDAPALQVTTLQAVRDELGDRGLEGIGLSVDDGPVSDFVARIRDDGVRYPLASAPPGAQRAFGHSGVLPATIVVDRDGRIAEYVEGALTGAEIRALVEPYLAAAPQSSRSPQ